MTTRQARWRLRNPWARYVEWARRRCNDPEHKSYSSYGARGVKVFMDANAARVLWERDGAARMVKPSLDRIDAEKHYTFENCRFVEHFNNGRAPHSPDVAAYLASERDCEFA